MHNKINNQTKSGCFQLNLRIPIGAWIIIRFTNYFISQEIVNEEKELGLIWFYWHVILVLGSYHEESGMQVSGLLRLYSETSSQEKKINK